MAQSSHSKRRLWPALDALRNRDDLKLLVGCADPVPNSFFHQALPLGIRRKSSGPRVRFVVSHGWIFLHAPIAAPEGHRVSEGNNDDCRADFDVADLRADSSQRRKCRGELPGEAMDSEIGPVCAQLLGCDGELDGLQERIRSRAGLRTTSSVAVSRLPGCAGLMPSGQNAGRPAWRGAAAGRHASGAGVGAGGDRRAGEQTSERQQSIKLTS